MKTLTLVLALMGLALLTGIMAWLGIGHVFSAMQRIGIGGFASIVGGQALVDIGLGIAWFSACPELGLFRAIASRAVRDAAGNCLPFSQLGGMVIGIRATCSIPTLTRRLGPLQWPAAVATNIVDITTEVLGQIVFVIIALACLFDHAGTNRFTWPVLGGMALLALGIAGFIWTQQRGGAAIHYAARFLGRHIADGWRTSLIDNMDNFQAELDQLWSRPGRIALGATIHLLCWLGGAAITWLSLELLGAHIGVVGAIAIEGVVCGLMSASFLVPAALGVQEAAYVALGYFFGVDAEISLGLSLLRRGRDIAIGIPVMALWQLSEMRRLRQPKRPTSADTTLDYADTSSRSEAS
ncbi:MULTISPECIES: lysylphosphatidylglycerol synthase domain-containing protein [Asaia]|uniref:lysylphosphatidylglycerol synthase domain-containing protein n=1 Tax=Asaia TaxID=91914 RepID=UPI001F11E541|nr:MULTISPECIES: lysylphosphatidylglycerol synthase domain-containing protein [Asaia]MDL2170816.1 lysylphosphatidylglycerol synthase domain-containing protein [Asaia sp. HumB]